MILDPSIRRDSSESALVSRIQAQIGELCPDGLAAGPDGIAELARAVERFIEESGDGIVDSQYLMLLTSQALSSIGESGAARRLYLFGSGMVRPAEWEVTGGERMWTLDLKGMTVRGDACLELIFFNGLGIVLESIADVWDETGGRGVLGLRHVCSVASALLGERAGRREIARLADEIKSLCSRKLAQLGPGRGWSASPDVMNLDLR